MMQARQTTRNLATKNTAVGITELKLTAKHILRELIRITRFVKH